MITDLATKRIYALSQWQTFLRVFTYKMAAEINWHRYRIKLRHYHPMYRTVPKLTDSQSVFDQHFIPIFKTALTRLF